MTTITTTKKPLYFFRQAENTNTLFSFCRNLHGLDRHYKKNLNNFSLKIFLIFSPEQNQGDLLQLLIPHWQCFVLKLLHFTCLLILHGFHHHWCFSPDDCIITMRKIIKVSCSVCLAVLSAVIIDNSTVLTLCRNSLVNLLFYATFLAHQYNAWNHR